MTKTDRQVFWIVGSLVAGGALVSGVILYGHHASLDQTTISVQQPMQTASVNKAVQKPDQATAATESGIPDVHEPAVAPRSRTKVAPSSTEGLDTVPARQSEPCMSWGQPEAYLERLESGYRYFMEVGGMSVDEVLESGLDACIDRVEEGDEAALKTCRECVRAIIESIDSEASAALRSR